MAVIMCCLYFSCVYWYIILNVPATQSHICSPHPMRFTDAVKFCHDHNGTLIYNSERFKTFEHSILSPWSGTYTELTSWFSIQGCFRVNITESDDVTLESVQSNGSNNSLITCYNSCKRLDQQHVYFYLRGEACLCSYFLRNVETVDDKLCDTRCSGDDTDFCGASSYLYTVYKEEDTLQFNNNKDHLCMYQLCNPSRGLKSGNCETSFRSICGEHVSEGNSTWSESVNKCFSSRGLYLKSDMDCKIGNTEGLWLGVFRKHVIYKASERIPLPGKPLTGCSIIDDNGVTTLYNCREERPFVCILQNTATKYNCSDTTGQTTTPLTTVTIGSSSDFSPVSSNNTQPHDPILYIAISSMCLIMAVCLILGACLRRRLLLQRHKRIFNSDKEINLQQDTEMKMLVPLKDSTSFREEHKYYCIYSLQKMKPRSPVAQSTISNIPVGEIVEVLPKSRINEKTTSDGSFEGERDLKDGGEKSVYCLVANADTCEKPQNESFAQNETSGKQSRDKFVYDLAAINHIVSDNTSNGKETKLNENGEICTTEIAIDEPDRMSKPAEELPYQEINFDDYDILHKPRLKHCDDQEDTNGSYDRLPRRHRDDLNDVIHSHALQEF